MATKYAIAVTGTVDWSSDAQWSTSSGGSNDTTAPAAGDEIIFDNASGTGTMRLTAATAIIKSITFNGGTGFAGTFAFQTYSLNVGDGGTCFVTFSSGMATTAGTDGGVFCQSSLTITWNGFTYANELRLRGTSQTYTLADAGTCGLLQINGTTTVTLNSSTLNASGGLRQNGGDFAGNTALTLSGGTWSRPGGGAHIISMTFAGNVTISPTLPPSFKTGTLTYSSGTVTTTGSTLNLLDTCTLNTSGITWDNVAFPSSGTPTITLNSALNAATLTIGATSQPIFTGTAGFNVTTLTGATVTSGVRTLTLKYDATVTYVAGTITLAGTDNTTNYRTIASSSATAGQRALLNVTGSASLTFVRVTRIDGSGGVACYTTGTITDSVNWTEPPAGGVMWLS